MTFFFASITSCLSLVTIHQILPATATRVGVTHPTVTGTLIRSGYASRIMDLQIHNCDGYLKEQTDIAIDWVL